MFFLQTTRLLKIVGNQARSFASVSRCLAQTPPKLQTSVSLFATDPIIPSDDSLASALLQGQVLLDKPKGFCWCHNSFCRVSAKTPDLSWTNQHQMKPESTRINQATTSKAGEDATEVAWGKLAALLCLRLRSCTALAFQTIGLSSLGAIVNLGKMKETTITFIKVKDQISIQITFTFTFKDHIRNSNKSKTLVILVSIEDLSWPLASMAAQLEINHSSTLNGVKA